MRGATGVSLRRAALVAAVAAICLAGRAPGALAASCPGAVECPYATVQAVGDPAGAMRFPEAVAVDPAGNVYVGDQLSFRIQEYSPSGSLEAEWGSYGGQPGQLGAIGGLATDPAGDLYVVDSTHDRVEEFGPHAEFIRAWGQEGRDLGDFRFGSSRLPGDPPGGGIAVAGPYVYVADTKNDRIERFNLQGGEPMQWGATGSGPGQLSFPRGLAANGTEVLVADDDNNRIERFGPAGEYEGQIGSRGAGPGQFMNPYGVALDAAGDAYVADDEGDRVVELTPELAYDRSWGGLGAAPGQLDYPRAIASDPAGDTWVADTANERVDEFDPEGRFVRSLGIPGGAPGVLTAPRGVEVAPTGELLAADTIGRRIELFTPEATEFLQSWSGPGGGFRSLAGPEGIATDPAGGVYVADAAGQRVPRLYGGEGLYLSELDREEGMQEPGDVARSPVDGDIYIADSGDNRILLYSAAGTPLGQWGGSGSSQAGSGPGEFDDPRAIATDAHGDLYVADYGNDRVQELGPEGQFLTQWGRRGKHPGQFEGPAGIAVSAAGLVYVSDYGNNRIEIFGAQGQYMGEWGAYGTGLGELAQPTAVATGCEGAVYVADTDNNRIERFAPAVSTPEACLGSLAWPQPLDVPPVLTLNLAHGPRPLTVPRLLRGRGLALKVACQRICRVTVTGTLSARGQLPQNTGRRDRPARARPPQRTVKLAGVFTRLGPADPRRVRLRLSPASVHSLARTLSRGGTVSARVTVTAVGQTGRQTVLRRGYTLRRRAPYLFSTRTRRPSGRR